MKILTLKYLFSKNLFSPNKQFLRHMTNKITLNLNQGRIIGEKCCFGNTKLSYYKFFGIPYAKPPIGDLRFKPPQKLEKFPEELLDCTKERNISLQIDFVAKKMCGSEDCLFLNVYTPKLKTDKPLPVMVWIHGGMFIAGSGNQYLSNPVGLLQEDVILVTLNYRLGAFGFLSIPNAGISGNFGLKDQLMALKWVNENIHNFNGDSNNITIIGQSAGAGSVSLHLLSDESKKYFHKAICQSGSCLNEWTIQNNSESKVLRLAKLLGFNGSPKDAGFFFKTLQDPAGIFQNMYNVFTKDERRREFPMPFKPVIETEDSEDPFLTKSPLEIMKTKNSIGEIPVMMGLTSQEGLMILVNGRKKLEIFENDLARMIPRSVNLDPQHPVNLEIANKLRNIYFDGRKIENNVGTLNALADLMTDFHFSIGMNQTAEIHAKCQHKSPLYFYRFSYDGELNYFKKFYQFQALKGASHGDELFYIFHSAVGIDGKTLQFQLSDEKIINKICKVWTNFAKFGNPTPAARNQCELLSFNWLPVKNVENNEEFQLDYLEIDSDIKMEKNLDKKRINFWKDIYNEWNGDFLCPKLYD